MTLFVLNLILAVVWQAVTGSFTLGGLAVGLVLGYAALWTARPLYGDVDYFRRVPRAIGFVLYFLKELVVSSLRVAYDVVTPPIHARPGLLKVPLDARTDLEIMLLANLVSLTPGTLSLDVSADRRFLYLHAMFAGDPDKVRREIKQGIERRLLELMR
jgi:multicomponent Na+:H+ antiporter subunit E